MKRVLVFTCLILLAGCETEEMTFSNFIISNQSGVSVKILPTKAHKDTLILKPGEKKEFDRNWHYGITSGIDIAVFLDGGPVQVIFAERDTITHYRDTLTHTGRYYSRTSVRNLYNTASYQKEILDRNKHARDVILRYTFTREDYVDAKK